MSEIAANPAPSRLGNAVQFIIALIAAVTIGAAGAYMLLRPDLEYVKVATEETTAARAAAESQHEKNAYEVARMARPDPKTEPLRTAATLMAEISKRVDLAATPHPPSAEVEAVRKLAVAALDQVVEEALQDSPNPVSERLIASALAESDRMAALGITFPTIEARIQMKLHSFREPSLSIRWLKRMVQYDTPSTSGATAPIPSREVTNNVRFDALHRLHGAAREAGDYELALRALEEIIELRERNATNSPPSPELNSEKRARAHVLAALGRMEEAGPILRESWAALVAAPKKDGNGGTFASTGWDYARLLLAQDHPKEALEVMEAVMARLNEQSESRSSQWYLKSQMLHALILSKVNQPAESEWICREMALVLEVEANLQTGWGEPNLGKELAEAEQWRLAEQLYWTDLLCSLYSRDEKPAIRLVKGLVQMAGKSPEGAKAVGDVLPVYERWLKRMDAKSAPAR